MYVIDLLASGLTVTDIFNLGAAVVIDWVENLIPLINIGGEG